MVGRTPQEPTGRIPSIRGEEVQTHQNHRDVRSDESTQSDAESEATSEDGALPSWLRFDAGTRTFSAAAGAPIRNTPITVTAINGEGVSASDSFVLQTNFGSS